MEDLSSAYKDAGIVVPIFHNDFNKNIRGGSWNPKDYPGVLDLYGLDSYPRGFDCANPQRGFNIDTGYYNHFARVDYGGPAFTPEFQGGAFDPWAVGDWGVWFVSWLMGRTSFGLWGRCADLLDRVRGMRSVRRWLGRFWIGFLLVVFCADGCFSPEFVDVYYKNNVAQGFTMQSYYMVSGGAVVSYWVGS